MIGNILLQSSVNLSRTGDDDVEGGEGVDDLSSLPIGIVVGGRSHNRRRCWISWFPYIYVNQGFKKLMLDQLVSIYLYQPRLVSDARNQHWILHL